ncbi:hypothetical protein ABZ719_01350 [Streptomyces sp. NPDC006743]|uniref:hypothetical protein n=1 Tax=Streptomyces sp. NPDC006743 TaxID=3154480 RepID=UPI003452035F
MTALTFTALEGTYELTSAVVLATAGHAARLADLLPAGAEIREVAPGDLRGRRDPASRLGELAATVLAEAHPPGGDAFSRGVFISSRRGNQASVRQFTGALAAGRRSPAAFSVSGYNIVAQSVARCLPAQGPSVVLAGRRATLDGALLLAALRLASGAVDSAYAGHVTWLPSGEGLAVLTAVRRGAAACGGDGDGGAQRSAGTRGPGDAVRLDPRRLFVERAAQDGLGAEDLAAVGRVAPLLGRRAGRVLAGAR